MSALLFPESTGSFSSEARVDQIVRSLSRDNFCSIIGPRKTGKTKLANQVIEKAKANILFGKNLVVCPIDFHRDSLALKATAFRIIGAKLLASVRPKVRNKQGNNPALINTEIDFVEYLNSILNSDGRRVLLVLDHLEEIPSFVIKSLLKCFRAIYQQRDQPQYRNLRQLVILICGTINLEDITSDSSTSPFISHKFVSQDFTHQETVDFAIKITYQGKKVFTSQSAKGLTSVLGGDVHSLILFTKFSLEELGNTIKLPLSLKQVINLANIFKTLYHKKSMSFRWGMNIIERSASSMKIIHRLISNKTVKFAGPPMANEVELSGFVVRGHKYYQWRNELYESAIKAHFKNSTLIDKIISFGTKDQAIDILESFNYSKEKDGFFESLISASKIINKSRSLTEAVETLFRILEGFLGNKPISFFVVDSNGVILRSFYSVRRRWKENGFLGLFRFANKNTKSIIFETKKINKPFLVNERDRSVSVSFPISNSSAKHIGTLIIHDLFIDEDYKENRNIIYALSEFAKLLGDQLSELIEKLNLFQARNILLIVCFAFAGIIVSGFPGILASQTTGVFAQSSAQDLVKYLTFILALSNPISLLFLTYGRYNDTFIRNILLIVGFGITIAIALNKSLLSTIFGNQLTTLTLISMQVLILILLLGKRIRQKIN